MIGNKIRRKTVSSRIINKHVAVCSILHSGFYLLALNWRYYLHLHVTILYLIHFQFSQLDICILILCLWRDTSHVYCIDWMCLYPFHRHMHARACYCMRTICISFTHIFITLYNTIEIVQSLLRVEWKWYIEWDFFFLLAIFTL